MKISIKCVYTDRVEPTLLKEIDITDDSSKSELNELILSKVREILDNKNNTSGLFIGVDK